MGDGQCERMNKTIIAMLKTLAAKDKLNWHKQLGKLAYAYNSTVHKSTGFSPHFLMFGREARMPVDSVLTTDAVEPKMQKSYANYVNEWERSMNEAFAIAKQHAEKSGERNKRYYDQKVRGVAIEVGDRVLLRNHKEKGGTGKLKNFWEDVVYRVEQRDNSIPVFTIRPEDGSGQSKRVHKNNIMKCNDILPLPAEKDVLKPQKQKRKRGSRGKRCVKQKQVVVSQSESDSEDEIVIVRRRTDSRTNPGSIGEREEESGSSRGPVLEETGHTARVEPESVAEVEHDSETIESTEEVEIALNVDVADDREPAQESGEIGEETETNRLEDVENESGVNANDSMDTTFPYEEGDPPGDVERLESTDSSGSESEPGEKFRRRRPQRNRKPPQRMTYDEIGGNPVSCSRET